MTSYDDPIVAEVRAIRERLAAKHGNTVEGIFKHYREIQETSGRKYVRYPSTRVEPERREVATPSDEAKK